MSAQVQFDMFKETTSEDVLKAEVAALRESHDKVRKRLFGEVRGLQKLMLNQQNELDYLRMKMGLSCIMEQKL